MDSVLPLHGPCPHLVPLDNFVYCAWEKTKEIQLIQLSHSRAINRVWQKINTRWGQMIWFSMTWTCSYDEQTQKTSLQKIPDPGMQNVCVQHVWNTDSEKELALLWQNKTKTDLFAAKRGNMKQTPPLAEMPWNSVQTHLSSAKWFGIISFEALCIKDKTHNPAGQQLKKPTLITTEI